MEANEISTADLAGTDEMEGGAVRTDRDPTERTVESVPDADPQGGIATEQPETPTPADVATADPSQRDGTTRDTVENEDPALLSEEQSGTFRARWDPIQGAFVDEPSVAVHDADGLVAEVMQAVARSFADERAGLEARWKQGEDVSTEDLRVTLQRYRSFFNRLLTA